MSWQRKRRGRYVTLYWPSTVLDNRGNEVQQPLGGSERTRFTETYDRGNKAEMPGFQEVQIRKIIVDHRTKGAGLWSRAEIDGEWYDVYQPPAYRHGTKHVRHTTLSLRKRPDGSGLPKEATNG